MVHVKTTINGQPAEFLVPAYLSLLDTIREVVGLTGAKEGCLDGNCGACTVILNGRIVDSCLVLGAEANGGEITTVEGLATPDALHPLQQAFLEEAALQCGICTPGFLVSAAALLKREPKANEQRIRHWLAGNLCRCTGYDKIVRAVIKAEDMSSQLSKSKAKVAAKPTAKSSASPKASSVRSSGRSGSGRK